MEHEGKFFLAADNTHCDAEMKYGANISTDSYRRLNRACAVSKYMSLELCEKSPHGIHNFYITHIMSYIGDDISVVLEEIKEKGLTNSHSLPAE